MTPKQIAPHLFQLNLGFVNAYIITTLENDWVLVDTGLEQTVSLLKPVEKFFGKPPLAIILTHGHLDHAGGARELAEHWSCRVYVHRLERPFLTGKAVYPPKDPTIGGALAQMSRVTPWKMFNLTGLLEEIHANGHFEFLPGWQAIETPGHTAGHISLWNDEHRILIAGDAFSTMNTDSYIGAVTMKPELSRPGAPFTSDWGAAKHSVGILADLEPAVIVAGHGKPMVSGDLPQQLRDFYTHFELPEHGRYAHVPAKSDESGVTSLPAAPPDDFTRNAAVLVGAASVLAIIAKFFWRRK